MDGLEQDRQLIRDLVAFANIAPATLARQAGVSPSTIQRPYSGTATTRLGRNALEKLQAAYPDFPGWKKTVVSDDRLPFRGFPTERNPALVDVAYVDLKFGLGSAFMDQEIVEHQAEMMSFPVAWLRQITKSPPSMLYWARGEGDSMEPKIGDGDMILIDRSQTNPTMGDLIFAFAYGQTGMVKRLRPMPDGSLKIMSDNPAVPPELAYDGEVNIFGRVIRVVKGL